ncbi:uncharacterized protein LOC125885063 [Epinephelus fuscoguttatus]|uniref:uncharacterized protein LOC125885063 n=1 Tax=Epinephelus fuscoguttatus TaxID=293821 RepID=UPI0020D1CEFE|nr:uncharacterized protein LOC125885063 [Epinephelus fuscoguttatus]
MLPPRAAHNSTEGCLCASVSDANELRPKKSHLQTQHPVKLRIPMDTSTHSTSLLDSYGIYVNMELNYDGSRLRSDSEETDYHKEKKESDSPKINPQPEGQINNGELSEKDQAVKCIVLSDPGLVIRTAERLQGSASALIPEVESRKALRSPSMLSAPLPLPKRSPACEKKNKTLNSLACQTSPVLDGVKGNSPHRGLSPLEVPDMHNCTASGILPKVEAKHPPQLPLRPLTKSPIKPPRPNTLKRAETEEGEGRVRGQAEWSKEQRNRQEQDLTERSQKTEVNKQTSGKECHLDVGKPPRQMLVVFTDIGTEEDVRNIGLTFPTMTENSSLLASGCSDLTSDVEPDMAATNRNCTSTVSAKKESIIPLQPPPKPPQKHPPKPPIKPPHLFSAMKSVIEEEKERRKQEDEEWRDLVEEERDKKEGDGEDRGKVHRDSRGGELSTTTMTEKPSQLGQTVLGSVPKFCLMPPCRDRPRSVVTAENQTLDRKSQHPGNHQNKANGQVQSGPQEVPSQISPTGTDTNVETLKWTENSKEIQISGTWGRDSDVISKLPSGWEGTKVEGTKLDPFELGLKSSEDAQEVDGTLMHGEPKQTNQKTNTRGKVKNLAKKMIGRLKEGREERKRTKATEMEMEDSELTQDERRHGKEGWMNDEEEGPDEDAVDHLAPTETQRHVDLMERRIKGGHATSYSPFASFEVGSPVKLVEELLTGDERFQFLNRDQSSTPDPPDTEEPSADLQFTLDEFEGNSSVSKEESVYEIIDCSDMMTEESQIYEQLDLNRAPSPVPQSETSETIPLTPRTKNIYDTVKFFPPAQPTVTHMTLSDIKSQGVLDSSVQKYLIKLSKKRKHRTGRRQRGDRSNDVVRGSLSSTTPQQIFPASVFYCVPAAGGEVEQQLSAVKCGGSSPRSLAKLKIPLKDKTIPRVAQPKEDRGK